MRLWMAGGLALALALAVTTADAQIGGGRPGSQRGGTQSSSDRPAPTRSGPGLKVTPVNQIVIVGVITALDPHAGRVTIAYDPVDELNWPKGTMPFPVSNPGLLAGVKVGQKVRFKVDNHEIYELAPY